MEIRLFYSKQNSRHRQAAKFVKKAVRNLGISATIVERDSKMAFPRLVVDGFDVSGMLAKPTNGSDTPISYEMVEKIIERTAW
jgi:hypothetical protein